MLDLSSTAFSVMSRTVVGGFESPGALSGASDVTPHGYAAVEHNQRVLRRSLSTVSASSTGSGSESGASPLLRRGSSTRRIASRIFTENSITAREVQGQNAAQLARRASQVMWAERMKTDAERRRREELRQQQTANGRKLFDEKRAKQLESAAAHRAFNAAVRTDQMKQLHRHVGPRQVGPDATPRRESDSGPSRLPGSSSGLNAVKPDELLRWADVQAYFAVSTDSLLPSDIFLKRQTAQPPTLSTAMFRAATTRFKLEREFR